MSSAVSWRRQEREFSLSRSLAWQGFQTGPVMGSLANRCLNNSSRTFLLLRSLPLRSSPGHVNWQPVRPFHLLFALSDQSLLFTQSVLMSLWHLLFVRHHLSHINQCSLQVISSYIPMNEFWVYLRNMYNSDFFTSKNMFIYKSIHLLVQ